MGFFDPVAATILLVDPPEDQRRIAHLELGQPRGHGIPDGLPLEPGLVGTTSTHLDHVRELERPLPCVLQAGECVVQVLLFRNEFGMHLDRFSWVLEDGSEGQPRVLAGK